MAHHFQFTALLKSSISKTGTVVTNRTQGLDTTLSQRYTTPLPSQHELQTGSSCKIASIPSSAAMKRTPSSLGSLEAKEINLEGGGF
jgi:hypothetical protein